MQPVDGLRDLVPRYDALLVDAWGVLHDGGRCFDDARECLQRLSQAELPVIVLSNAARREISMDDELECCGIDRALYRSVVTSGELVWQALVEGKFDPPAGRNGFYFGPERSQSLTHGLDFNWVADIGQADFVLNTGPPEGNPVNAESYRPLLERMADRRLPMVCANPDRFALRHGELGISAGSIAALYREVSDAPVHSLGKPHGEMFRQALARLDGVDQSRVLVVGDGLETDIVGADRAGLDSLFVIDGIHRESLANEPRDRLAKLGALSGALPVYYCQSLRW